MPLSGNSEAGGMTLIGSGQIQTADAFLNRKPRATAIYHVGGGAPADIRDILREYFGANKK
jgi:hypothetical protein